MKSKYFKEEKFLYFHSSDAHTDIEGDTYLKYNKRLDGRIELSFGGNNGEVCIKVCQDIHEMDKVITAIIT